MVMGLKGEKLYGQDIYVYTVLHLAHCLMACASATKVVRRRATYS